VKPGDYVFADSSGAVVIPGGQVHEVVTGAREVEGEDARSREQIKQEDLRGEPRDRE
jgi:regulator of RNase E activity RraA